MPSQFVTVDRFHAILLDRLGIEVNDSQIAHAVRGRPSCIKLQRYAVSARESSDLAVNGAPIEAREKSG